MKKRRPATDVGALEALSPERAIQILNDALPSKGKEILEVRARGPRNVACLIVRANLASVRLAKSIGLELTRGASVVFGLLGEDAARLFSSLEPHQLTFLRAPSARAETKVLLVAGKMALISIVVKDGNATVTPLGVDSTP